MKSYTILCALTATVASSALHNAHQMHDLAARAKDPSTMNPTQVSILSILRTAMPSGPDVPLPSGDFEPDWYKNLPADVKSLLPVFYPAKSSSSALPITPSRSSTSYTTGASSAEASTIAGVIAPAYASASPSAPASEPEPDFESESSSGSESCTSARTISSAAAPTPEPSILSSTVSTQVTNAPPNAPVALSSCTSQTTVTESVRYPYPPASNTTVPLPTIPTDGTGPAASYSPIGYISGGTKGTMGMGTLAAIAWLGVGTGFVLFA